MPMLLVAYDLIAPNQNYAKVTARIEAAGDTVKLQRSLYLLRTDLDALQAADFIEAAMDADDKLLVSEPGEIVLRGEGSMVLSADVRDLRAGVGAVSHTTVRRGLLPR